MSGSHLSYFEASVHSKWLLGSHLEATCAQNGIRYGCSETISKPLCVENGNSGSSEAILKPLCAGNECSQATSKPLCVRNGCSKATSKPLCLDAASPTSLRSHCVLDIGALCIHKHYSEAGLPIIASKPLRSRCSPEAASEIMSPLRSSAPLKSFSHNCVHGYSRVHTSIYLIISLGGWEIPEIPEIWEISGLRARNVHGYARVRTSVYIYIYVFVADVCHIPLCGQIGSHRCYPSLVGK